MDHLAVLACAAVFELQTLQVPSLRTIFQRKDRVADTQIDERLGADNAARAACTVNDDCRFFIRKQLVNPIGQLTIGAAHRLRDIYFSVLIEWAPIQYRSEEHTSELQSLMRNSYAVF